MAVPPSLDFFQKIVSYIDSKWGNPSEINIREKNIKVNTSTFTF